MPLSAPDYVAALARHGALRDGAALPELNRGVWARYLGLYGRSIGDPGALEVLQCPSGPGFYADPLNGSGVLEWALQGPISHGILPWTAAQVLAAAAELPGLCAAAGRPPPRVQTDSFGLARPPTSEEARHFLWLRSPRARFGGSFEGYVASLNHDRRKDLRAMIRRFDAIGGLRFELTPRPPDDDEQAFVTTRSAARFGEDAPYALAQWLWPLAIAQILPQSALFLRATLDGQLVLLAAYVLRGEDAICQATCREERAELPGLGGFADAEFIRRSCGGPLRTLDPTVRTGVEDTPGIWVSKRRLVNEDHLWPTLLVGDEAPEIPELSGQVPILRPTSGWALPGEPARIGRPA